MNRSRALLVLAVVLVAAALCCGVSRARAADPTPPFSDTGVSLAGLELGSLDWGDYDSDGDLDLLMTGNDGYGTRHTIVYRNNGNGTFTDLSLDLPGVTKSSAAWGDYDSDGKLDILLTGEDAFNTAIAKLYRGSGDGTFTEITGTGLFGVYESSVAWGDYNSDGRPDILLSGWNGSVAVTSVYRNNGDGTFTDIGAGLIVVRGGATAWGDYNSDGRPDILLTGVAGSGPVTKLYRNDGGGSFTEIATSLVSVYASSVAWGDYDADNDLDILLAGLDSGPTRYARVYRNNGDGTFTDIAAGLAGGQESSGGWGDYDADGDLDILLTSSDGSTYYSSVYRNDGDGTFTDIGAGLTDVANGGAAWGDYDSDGRLDIALTGYYYAAPTWYRAAKIYHNDTATSNTLPSAPASLAAAPVSGSVVTLSWQAASDAKQPNGAGLTYNLRVGTTPGASDVVAPMALANGTRLVARDGNAGERTSYTLTSLTPGATYYWSVQAIDSSFAGSGFAIEGSFTMAPIFAFSTTDYSVGEGDGPATITINRSSLTAISATVHFTTANGTATAGSDYTAVDQIATFAAGETSKTVSIPITNDSSIEGNETVQLSLSSPSTGATLGSPSSATLTIIDNDRAFAFSSASYSVNEGHGPATVTINRTGLTSGSDSVDFATANGTATAGSDYTAVTQTVSFAIGETSKTVSVPITDDSQVESSETVLLSLSSPSAGAELGNPHSATLTISDNDVAPPPPAKPSGKLTSAKLTKTSFPASQAGTVKLTCKFSPKSKIFRYLLSVKKGTKWALVKRVNKTGFYKVKYTTIVKKLFAGKPVKRGRYRLKLSADRNSRTLSFRVT